MPDTTDDAAARDRPNILILCTDQQRFNALRAAGNAEIETPAIDRLAAQGVLFENCYVQSPVCAPSRASLMTGQYVHSHGLWANGVGLSPHARLFTRDLADAGYDTGLAGKFHLSACFAGRTEPRLDDGFRVFRWAHDPYPGSSENQYHRWLSAAWPQLHARALDPADPLGFDELPTEAHYTRWIGDETVEFLTSGREDGKPFCFIANFFDPHHGFGAPQEYLDRYRPEELAPPVTCEGELDVKPAILREASRESYAGHERGYTDYTADELRQTRAAYYAMVSFVDDEVGRVLDTLEEQGLADTTLVVFTSDHGEMLGDHQLMLKGPMMYEPAVRVPLVLRWPGHLPEGARRDDLVQWLDLPSTLLDAATVDGLPAAQGQSLLPLATGEQDAPRRGWALCEYRNSGHPYDPAVHTTMLRTGRWKIVVHHGDPATGRDRTGELYDLDTDPDELVNRWDDTAFLRDRVALQEMLIDVLVATEDRSQPRDAFW
ncbi:sulfatase-like hydrolase/transferase [Prauserella cavernicola]|uniref:Sulfatase-like hydrolase/transferase n=1 Tax=Prauserella cavernicola TaxID=2800127 RepID=A0A934V8D3_9PSEU|nr:sulfatase-like hydrolase/transferase [Prauserella cavernicola]MBK1787633.1 sulfatase-like hydrolase/transferase [Prauserella cavernicola]